MTRTLFPDETGDRLPNLLAAGGVVRAAHQACPCSASPPYQTKVSFTVRNVRHQNVSRLPGQQLLDLKKACDAGAMSKEEYEGR